MVSLNLSMMSDPHDKKSVLGQDKAAKKTYEKYSQIASHKVKAGLTEQMYV
jgi:hypothetical protein